MSTPATTYKRYVLAVDSRNRIDPAYTTPSQYKISFPPLKNVKMARLLSTEVPNSEYVLHSRNCLLYLWDGLNTTEHKITLTPGTYTATEMANELNKQLNAALNAPFGAIFQVTYMTMTVKFRIDRVDGQRFELRFAQRDNTAATVLGFDSKADALAVQYTNAAGVVCFYTQSTTVANLAGENFIYLCIKGMPTLNTTELVQDVFAKIILNVPARATCFDSFVSNAFIYPQPQGFLSQLDISFVRHDGQLFDFNTIEHSFTMEFMCL